MTFVLKRFFLGKILYLSIFLGQSLSLYAREVGFTELTVHPNTARPLSVAVWYPTNANSPSHLLQDNALFVGQLVVLDAPIEESLHPVALLSHGFGGNLANQSWLAYVLAQKGFVVLAPNHPGTTSLDMKHPRAAALWQRPDDLSYSLDALWANKAWLPYLDKTKVAAIGHSLGGWTAMLLGGARFDPLQFEQLCKTNDSFVSCKVYQTLLAGGDPKDRAALAHDKRDQRVTAVVSLDLGLSFGLTKQSLARMPVPVFVIAAGALNPTLPASVESHAMQAALPVGTPYLEIAEASHFSFLQVCKPEGPSVLQKENPEDEDICLDATGADRARLHQEIADAIFKFLDRVF